MRRIVALIMLSVFLLGCAEEKPEKFECSDTDGTVNPTRAGTVYSYDYRDGITDYCKDNLTLVEYTYERVSFGCLAKPVEINCFD